MLRRRRDASRRPRICARRLWRGLSRAPADAADDGGQLARPRDAVGVRRFAAARYYADYFDCSASMGDDTCLDERITSAYGAPKKVTYGKVALLIQCADADTSSPRLLRRVARAADAVSSHDAFYRGRY